MSQISYRRAIGIGGLVAWLGSCSEPSSPCSYCTHHHSIVSDPIQTSFLATAGEIPRGVTSTAEQVAFVSLPPGSVPDGDRAAIARFGDTVAFTTRVVDGGFDPIPIIANLGDVIEVDVRNALGVVISRFSSTVSAARHPVVVRTNPPPGKRDVPLNAAIVVVFSEPVNPSTLTTSSIELRRGTEAVSGTVSLLEGSQTVAVFTPEQLLAPNAEYALVVTDVVTDLDGLALETGVIVDFTTGQSRTGAPASILISPDTVYLTESMGYQLTATVRDAAGDMLVNLPLSWVSNDTTGLATSPKGRVLALAPGFYIVTASLDKLAGFARVIVRPGVPAAVTIAPAEAVVGAAGDTIILTAMVRDAYGRSIRYPDVTWSSSALGVANAAPYDPGDGRVGLGMVTGVDLGRTMIAARSGSVADTITVTVVPPPPVASVTITAPRSRLLVGLSLSLSATVRDANGRVLPARQVAWTSDNPVIATVSSDGLVRGLAGGVINVMATSDGVSDTATISVVALTLRSIVAGYLHTCAVASDGSAYCWGSNSDGQLGDGSTISRLAPVLVSGGFAFSILGTWEFHTCGLDIHGNAYCWGHNAWGELGNASTRDTTSPVPVAGGLLFNLLPTGWMHTCGLTPAGRAYCWGRNRDGELGDSTTTEHHIPVVAGGGLVFSTLTAWGRHTCGLSGSGTAFCWGWNQYGQLGTGSNSSSSVPAPVGGGLSFSTISAGRFHTCGLTGDGTAYCWGQNAVGQLGSGTTTNEYTPAPVSGGLHFVIIASGEGHTCALTAEGHAYCWGWNDDGELGDGSTISSATPVAVTGGHQFSAITTGGYHTCALSLDGLAYCWGYNGIAQLGDGTTSSSSVPVRVAGQP